MLCIPYLQNCTAESDRELSCIFPAILPNLLDDIRNGTLNFTYSLVFAGVPGLDNLNLMSQFVFGFVDDLVVNPFSKALFYQAGSNAVNIISVSKFHVHVCSRSVNLCAYH